MGRSVPARRYLLAAAGLGVIVYSVAVLFYVGAQNNLGFKCVLGNRVHRILEPSRSATGQPTIQIGDRVYAIRGQEVSDYPAIVRAIERLPDGASLPSPQSGPNDVLLEGTRYVRVTFYRPDAGEDRGPRHVTWAVVGKVPTDTYVLALLWFVLELGIFTIGALVVWRRPENDPAALFFLLCVTSVGAYMGGYHWDVIVGEPVLITVFIVCAVMLPVVSLHFYLIFPRPKNWVRRRRWLTWACVYGPAVSFLIALLALVWIVMTSPGLEYEAMRRTLRGIQYLSTAYMGVAAAYSLGCMACLIHSLRTSRNRLERNQLRWILFGSIPATGLLAYILYLAINDLPRFVLGGAVVPMFMMSLFFTLGYALAIVRYRLMRVQEIATRSMLYFAVSVAAAAGYAGLIALVALVVGGARADATQAIGVFLTVFLLAIGLGFLRNRLQKALDRRFYREKYQLDKAMQRMSEALSRVEEPSTSAERLLSTIVEVVGASNGAIYLRQGRLRQGHPPQMALAARAGGNYREGPLPEANPIVQRLSRGDGPLVVQQLSSPQDNPELGQLSVWEAAIALPMRIDDRFIGIMCLGLPLSEEPYEPEELAFLAALARVGAMTAESANAYDTIQELNRDLGEKVNKIAEQQRRIVLLQERLMKPAEGQIAESVDGAAMDFGQIKGSGSAVRQMLELVAKVAVSESAVLIQGESGTGKGLLAEAIHANSPRADKRFVEVHCAALSPGVLESELFGHVRGAFTGAVRDKEGLFERADGGTLFLDEIGDISLETQTKLLRVLQEMAFERVGSTETVRVDVRLIAATNQDLLGLIQRGAFREDLYYRLNVISIRVPPLRERSEDIFELAVHFMQTYAARAGKPIRGLDESAVSALTAYPWPGNIRQLENAVERAVVLAEGPSLTLADLPDEVRAGAAANAASDGHPAVAAPIPGEVGQAQRQRLQEALERTLLAERPEKVRDGAVADAASDGRPDPARLWRREVRRFEREHLREALRQAGGNKAAAARRLGIPRSTLFSKLKKYGL